MKTMTIYKLSVVIMMMVGATNIFHYYGIEPPLIVAGLAGGFYSLNKKLEISNKMKLYSILSAGIASNYVTPIFKLVIDKFTEETPRPLLMAFAFGVGFMGYRYIEKLFNKIIKTKSYETGND